MTQPGESDSVRVVNLIRLTSLRVKDPGSEDWIELARDQASVDLDGAYVKLLDDLPVQAIDGAEVELRVRWEPPVLDPDEDLDDA